MTDTPSVLFVGTHDTGRSQIAAAWARHLAGDLLFVCSAATPPVEPVHRVVVDAMTEVGVDISATTPLSLNDDIVRSADIIVTMGCSGACTIFPDKWYQDWGDLAEPAGQPLDAVRRVRDQMQRRVRELLTDILPPNTWPALL